MYIITGLHISCRSVSVEDLKQTKTSTSTDTTDRIYTPVKSIASAYRLHAIRAKGTGVDGELDPDGGPEDELGFVRLDVEAIHLDLNRKAGGHREEKFAEVLSTDLRRIVFDPAASRSKCSVPHLKSRGRPRYIWSGSRPDFSASWLFCCLMTFWCAPSPSFRLHLPSFSIFWLRTRLPAIPPKSRLRLHHQISPSIVLTAVSTLRQHHPLPFLPTCLSTPHSHKTTLSRGVTLRLQIAVLL